jgi:Tfp pilus assembly protein PilF
MGNIMGDYAYFLHLQKENTNSLAKFERAVELAPTNAHVLCSYAAVLNSNGRQRDATRMYRRAKAANPHEQCVQDLAGSFGGV